MKKIDHIGIATNNPKKLIEEYKKKGYVLLKNIYDPHQKAELYMLDNKNKNNIELVYTNNPSSPVYNLCRNNYKNKYHVCYCVDSIEYEIKLMRKKGYIPFTNIVYAELLNGNICFLFSKEKGIIELVQKNN